MDITRACLYLAYLTHLLWHKHDVIWCTLYHYHTLPTFFQIIHDHWAEGRLVPISLHTHTVLYCLTAVGSSKRTRTSEIPQNGFQTKKDQLKPSPKSDKTPVVSPKNRRNIGVNFLSKTSQEVLVNALTVPLVNLSRLSPALTQNRSQIGKQSHGRLWKSPFVWKKNLQIGSCSIIINVYVNQMVYNCHCRVS